MYNNKKCKIGLASSLALKIEVKNRWKPRNVVGFLRGKEK